MSDSTQKCRIWESKKRKMSNTAQAAARQKDIDESPEMLFNKE